MSRTISTRTRTVALTTNDGGLAQVTVTNTGGGHTFLLLHDVPAAARRRRTADGQRSTSRCSRRWT